MILIINILNLISVLTNSLRSSGEKRLGVAKTFAMWICGLLTKHEVKMAGYWPSPFFASLWTETKSRSINTQKRMRPTSSHLDRTRMVNKGFIIWDKTPKHDKFSLQDKACILSRQDSSITLAQTANHRV